MSTKLIRIPAGVPTSVISEAIRRHEVTARGSEKNAVLLGHIDKVISEMEKSRAALAKSHSLTRDPGLTAIIASKIAASDEAIAAMQAQKKEIESE